MSYVIILLMTIGVMIVLLLGVALPLLAHDNWCYGCPPSTGGSTPPFIFKGERCYKEGN
jgi:hypothetical protein